ncbi:hypothetical protein RRG08_046240 [Elysia crispata]|uniref:EF-hand domain-containing protein n=1 Tax=Elysia crispata TaxID=231223 RepID=A0AAE1D0R2_9GAST|nr:hypothetical protein RRG08_046240 [Elysia crispata]
MEQVTDPIEKVRQACQRRGGVSIKGLGRSFRIMDDSGNKELDFEEFSKGLNDYGLVDITEEDKRAMFDGIDKSGDGKIQFDEFLKKLRPPMSEARLAVVDQAFRKFDKSGDGVVTVEDLSRVYNVRNHPKYVSKEWTEKDCFSSFINSLECSDDKEWTEKDLLLKFY